MAQVLADTGLETLAVATPENGYRGLGRFQNLLSYESVGRWLRKRVPRTKYEYLGHFEKLLQWTGKAINVATPTELLAWAKGQEGVRVQDLLDQYTEGWTTSKGQVAVAAARSFLSRNGYRDLPKIDWASTMSEIEGYKRGEIQKLLGYLDSPFQKLYVLAAKDSGLRANDLLGLTYGQIAEEFEAGEKYVHIRFPKEAYQRRKAPGRTFFGPNSIDLIRQLVKEGRIKTQKDSKIFPFTYPTITGSLTWAKKAAGLREDVQPSHGLRKFFENQLDRVGMDHHKKNQLEGHSNGVRATYTSKDLSELRELYGQAYKYLDLTEEGAVSGEVGELRKQVKDLAADNQALKDQLAEALQMRKELDQIKRDLAKRKA